jgi:hypothetical protein
MFNYKSLNKAENSQTQCGEYYVEEMPRLVSILLKGQ